MAVALDSEAREQGEIWDGGFGKVVCGGEGEGVDRHVDCGVVMARGRVCEREAKLSDVEDGGVVLKGEFGCCKRGWLFNESDALQSNHLKSVSWQGRSLTCASHQCDLMIHVM